MTAGRTAREERAAKIAAARAGAQRAERRRRTSVIAGAVVATLVVAVGVGALVQSRRVASQRTAASVSAEPAGTTGVANQDVFVGKAGAPVTVTVYEDFQCPICRDFEQQSGPTLKSLIARGTVRADYRPIAFLDRASTTNYSTRSLSSVGCVLDTTPSAFPAYHDLLFANQPPENSAGLPDDKLAALAKQAGADAQDCITAHTYQGGAARVTDQASKDGVTGTPTILVNGTVLQDRTPQGLTAAVQAAARK